MKDFATAHAMRKRMKMAKGGKVSSDYDHGQKRGPEGYPKYQEQAQNERGVHRPVSGVTAFPGGKGTSNAGDYVKEKYAGKPLFSGKDHPAFKEHAKVRDEMKSMKKGYPDHFADGGFVEDEMGEYDPMEHPEPEMNEAAEGEDMDMIQKLLSQHFSKGGMVANDVGVAEADKLPAEYDDLVLRDDDMSDADYTGANSGDEMGNKQMDSDEHDIIARIMKSRAKKDRMPRPA